VTRLSGSVNSITVQWVAPDNGGNAITQYIVEWNGGSGSVFSQIGTTGAATTNFPKTGLTNGVSYEFRVIAENEVAESDPSNPTPLVAAVAPDAPGTPFMTYATKTTIDIEWTAPAFDGGSSVIDYQVEMDDGQGGGFVVVGSTGDGAILTWSEESLVTGREYFFKVKALNIIDYGSASSAVKIFAAEIPGTPAAPTLNSQSETVIAIDWIAPSNDGGVDLIGYLVQWNGGAGSVYSTIVTHVDLASLTFEKSDNISPGSTYEFRVIAINEVPYESLPSPGIAILAATFPGSLAAPTKLTADKTSIQI